jgi:hypothetical protein
MPAKAAPAKSTKSAKSAIYDQLEALLKRYSPPFTICPPRKVGSKRAYGLWSEKQVEIAGRKLPAVYFSGVIEQKNYVGFYYMPVYMNPKLKDDLPPRLVKLLKGKSCFHIKSLDAELLAEAKTALDLACQSYKKNGWV